MLGRRRERSATGRSGVTVKATKFQLAAFHTPHTTALSATSCYSPHDFSVCAFCEFRTLDPLVGPRRYGSGSKTPVETKSVDEETNLNSIDRRLGLWRLGASSSSTSSLHTSLVRSARALLSVSARIHS